MPNHFHLMIFSNENSVKIVVVGKEERNVISETIRQILSSYTQGVNKQEKRIGSLFTQNTNAKELVSLEIDYEIARTCFNYIHQNPYKALLVEKMEYWEFFHLKTILV